MHDKIAEMIRMMGQQLIDDADKIACKVDNWFDLSITVNIPTLTERADDIPSYDVNYSYYPKHESIEKWLGVDKK